MTIIGNNDVTDRSGQTTSLSPDHKLNDVDTLVCPAEQVLTEFHVKSYETSGTVGQTMGLAIYDITSGTNNAPLVASTSVTIDATTPDVYSVTGLSVDLSAYEGQTLAICVGRESQYNNELAFQDTTGHPRSSTTSVPFDANFAQQDTGAGTFYGVWAVTEPLSGTLKHDFTTGSAEAPASFGGAYEVLYGTDTQAPQLKDNGGSVNAAPNNTSTPAAVGITASTAEFGQRQYAEITVGANWTNFNSISGGVFLSAGNNGYYLHLDKPYQSQSSNRVYKVVGGTATSLAATLSGVTWAIGDKIGLLGEEVDGTVTLTIYRNPSSYDADGFPADGSVSSTTDTSLTSGTVGLVGFRGNGTDAYATSAYFAGVADAASAPVDIEVTIPSDIDLKWDEQYTLSVTDDAGTYTLDNVTLSAPDGWETIDIGSLNPNAGAGQNDVRTIEYFARTDAGLGGGGYTAIVGDTFAWSVTTITGDQSAVLSINNQTGFSVSPAADILIAYKFWDSTNETWTQESTCTVNDLGVPFVVSVTGDDPQYVAQDGSYVEQGATYSQEGGSSGAITDISHSIDVSTVGAYTVTYTYNDGFGYAFSAERTVIVQDETAPVITLTGASEVSVAHGDTYTELGATAADNNDGDITGDIVITDDINPNISGSYTVSYDVQDAAGNIAVTRTRTVHIPPQQLIVIDSITESKTSAVINFSYAGADITGYEYNLDGAGWQATTSPLTLSGLNQDTQYSLELRAVNGTQLSQITSDTFNTLPGTDITPDAFSFAAVVDQARSVYVVSNTVTVLGVDAGQDIPVTVSGGEYSVSTDAGSTWGAWTTTPQDVRLNYQLRTRNLTSSAYDAQVTSTLTIGGVSASFSTTTLADTVAPVISLTGGNVEVTQFDVWLDPGYSAIDNADGDISVSGVVITGSVDTDTVGTYVLTYTATDAAGNSSSTTRTVTVTPFVPADSTPPVIYLVGGNVEIQEGATWVDPGYSAIDDSDGIVEVTVSGTVDTSTPGPYTLTYSASDIAGNVANVSRIVTVIASVQYPITFNAPPSRTYVADRLNRIEAGEAVFIKQPSEVLDYDFDLTQWLASESDTLPEDNFSVSVDSSFTVRNAGVIPNTSRVKVWLDGGKATNYGQSYPVELTIITAGFRTAQFLIRIVVIDKV
ncbi:hypothetical protein A3765_28455 [Oleiphilus sp. HI0130]|nr:hypothetical protein A3765_28455 [Oleiphilus sp. HI0130]